ncbi:hypothetical protein FIU92_17865 (plasmid) [Ruegeria sp. THAF33]|nr:hypothetical protein FIU92_17865 [Ruegeria sp. THAF33]
MQDHPKKHETITTRRQLCIGEAPLLAATVALPIKAEHTSDGEADFLFLQKARGMTYLARERQRTYRRAMTY